MLGAKVSSRVHLIGPYPLKNQRKGYIASLLTEDSVNRCVSVWHTTTNAWNQNYNSSNPGNQNNNNKNNTNYVRAVRRTGAMCCA